MMTTRTAYPRPELVRENWTNLCGEWEFEFDFGKSGVRRGMQNKEKLERIICVPFCPESELSGIGYRDFIGACWYRKTVNVSPKAGERTLLNFEAAYHTTLVFVNGKIAGKHKGGYTPFTFDITDLLEDGDNSIAVLCEGDPRDKKQPSGKQSDFYESRGCMYTRSTGIYAPVWMETVPATYLKAIKMDPDVDNSSLACELTLTGDGEKRVTLTASLGGKTVGVVSAKTTLGTVKMLLDLDTLSLWSLETPTLYDLAIEVENGGIIDTVTSYFGMRKIEMDKKCLRINGKRVFQRLVLDQGYYPDGIYTAPNDEAFARDIKISQRVGFNGARLHERVFERRFLYEADRLGYLVWGEYPNWGFDYTKDENTYIYLKEWQEAMARDYNHPALIGWCPFNETGSRRNKDVFKCVYQATRAIDPMRPIIDTSGYVHVKTDIYDVHNYDQNPETFKKAFEALETGIGQPFLNVKEEELYEGQPYFVSEFGGAKWVIDEEPAPLKENELKNDWGYGQNPEDIEAFYTRFKGLVDVLLDNPKMCAFCYTQLTDVYQEQNGIYAFDRRAKFDAARLHAIMSRPAAIEVQE